MTAPTATEGSLVALCQRAPGPASVLIHPAGGGLGQYVALAARLGRRGPVFGLRAHGLQPGERPDRRVAEMVARYLPELTRLPAIGLLAGWSLGGILAWELAVELAAAGRTPAVAMIDSLAVAHPPQRVRRADLHAAVTREFTGLADPDARDRALATADAHLEAASRYRVRTVHNGPALLLTCAAEDREEQAGLWGGGCRGLWVREIPGGHFDVFGAGTLPALLGHLDDFLSGVDS